MTPLAHTILPGVVIAFLFGWPLALGALIMGVLTAIGIGALSGQGVVKEDTAIGVIFAGAFALGVAMLSVTGNYTVDLAHFLFGNLLGVSIGDLWMSLGLGTAVLLTIFFFYKEFLVISFDPVLATTLRLPANFLRYLLLVLIAVTVVVSLQVVGIALMMAMLVTPAAAASLLTRRLPSMMVAARRHWRVGQRDRFVRFLLFERRFRPGHRAGGDRHFCVFVFVGAGAGRSLAAMKGGDGRTAAHERMAALSAALRGQGYRLTAARRKIWQVLVVSGGHVTADELVRLVRAEASGVGRMTVYRTLDLLNELGLIRPVYQGTGAAHYVLMDQGHHHHLICSTCPSGG